jgi:anaerobic magnesium-protoporphyrin IX monomethyl ester cyclase
MKILLLNPPHPAIGSRIPQEHLPPLGLLALGGPLLDAGHRVGLLDAEFGPMTVDSIVSEIRALAPDAVLLGHSGSTSGHPAAARIARAVRAALPHVWIIYGGVYPTYNWPEIMEQEPAIDFIVRGEGEETVVRLVTALVRKQTLEKVPGIVFRAGTVPAPMCLSEEQRCPASRVLATAPAAVITDLDAYRVGWELIDHKRYSYWGNRRAVVVQFSRGCPHQCQYCGQRVFWRTWRHRDPVKFAAELARFHREHGVEVINFADENPTASRAAWQAFLEALIAQKVPLILVGSTRASDIVRDADILHLYKRAGVARFLLGIESTDESTLHAIRKGSTQTIDREAIRLLRTHDIISMAALVADFAQATDRDYWRTLRQILSYDPDQIQALYATPHRWTPFAREQANRRVIQTDLSRWDYKHQVLESKSVPNWRVLLWVKVIEAVSQLRPKSLIRLFAHPDRGFRAAMRWYYGIGRKVWPYELWHWLFLDHRTAHGPSLAEFLNGIREMGPEKSFALSRQPRWRGGELALVHPLNAVAEARISHIARASQAWPHSTDLLSLPRMDQGECAAVTEKAEPVCRL